MPTHRIRKTARADTEKLPDITGEKIVYAGGTECNVEIMSRQGSEPTIEAGSEVSLEGYTGTIEQQQAEILPQYKLDGSIVWELTTTLFVEGDSV
jgi:hypothetical protein